MLRQGARGIPTMLDRQGVGPLMSPELQNVVLGLVSATIAAICARLFDLARKRKRRHQAVRNHPIGGVYASSYTDEIGGVQRVIRDEVRIFQHGLEFTGISKNLETGRGFLLKGSIVDERYLTGTYGGEHRADGASGVFFMALDLLEIGCIQGLWSGFGAESGLILSGRWSWRKLSDVDIAKATPSDPLLPHASTLLNDALGSGFVTVDDLSQLAAADEGMVLLAKSPHGQVLGVGTAIVMSESDKEELTAKLEAAGVRRANLVGVKVGQVKTAAVVPAARGKGLGLNLVYERLSRLKALGCSTAIVLAWDSGSRQSSIGVLEAAGFSRVVDLPEFWREPEGQETFDCIRCGKPCVCTAVVMRRSLYDFEPRVSEDNSRWRLRRQVT